MQQRIKYQGFAPELMKQVFALNKAVDESGLEKGLLHLIKLRASQINGCSFCVDMHSKEALRDGDTQQRVFLVAAWKESPLFSDRDSYTLGWRHLDRPRRLRLFAEAYGLTTRDRHRLVRTVRKRIVDHIEGIRRMAAIGEPAFVRIVHKGHLRRPVRDLRLIDYERHMLEYALR